MGASSDNQIEDPGGPAPGDGPPDVPLLWPVPDEFLEISASRLGDIDRALGYFSKEPYVVFAYEPRAGEVVWKDGQSCGISHGAWDVMSERVEPVARQRGATLGGDGVEASHVLLVDRSRRRAYLAEPLMAEVFLCAMYGFSRVRCIDPGRWAQRERRREPEN